MVTKCSECQAERHSRCSYGDCPFDADSLGELLEKARVDVVTLREENKTLRDRLTKVERMQDRYRNGLSTLASTFYKDNQYQDYAKHVLGFLLPTLEDAWIEKFDGAVRDFEQDALTNRAYMPALSTRLRIHADTLAEQYPDDANSGRHE